MPWRIPLIAALVLLAALGALLAMNWALQTRAHFRRVSDPAFERLRARDGEHNPLVVGDAVAGSAVFWRSSRERAELERRASRGDASAAFELWQYYSFTTDDRASALRWLEQAARGGHEDAQLNLAIETGESDCAGAKRRLRKIADQTKDEAIRKRALAWIEESYLCAAKAPPG